MPQNIIKYHHIITRELLQFVKQKTGFIYKKKKKLLAKVIVRSLN